MCNPKHIFNTVLSCTSSVALGMAMSVSGSTTLVQTEISQQLLDRLKFATDIHGPQRMNTNVFGNHLASQAFMFPVGGIVIHLVIP